MTFDPFELVLKNKTRIFTILVIDLSARAFEIDHPPRRSSVLLFHLPTPLLSCLDNLNTIRNTLKSSHLNKSIDDDNNMLCNKLHHKLQANL